jgi:hypothetical protein
LQNVLAEPLPLKVLGGVVDRAADPRQIAWIAPALCCCGQSGHCVRQVVMRAGGMINGIPAAARGAPPSSVMNSRRFVCREKSIVRGDGGSVMTVFLSRPEARGRFG